MSIDDDIAVWQQVADEDEAESHNPQHTDQDRSVYAYDAAYARKRAAELKAQRKAALS